MNPRALPKLAMRPLLPTDVPLLAEIFRASIKELTIDDYNAAQQEAWASAADNVEAFGAKLAGELTLVATFSGARWALLRSPTMPASTCSTCIRPRQAGRRRMLCDALEKLAAARGTKDLTVEASDTATGFFEKRGFTARTRNTMTVAGEWLANTTMVKPLAAKEARHETLGLAFQRHWSTTWS